MTTIRLIAAGTALECEELKNRIRWLEIGAIQVELQKKANREFYDPTPAQAALNRKADLSAPLGISVEDAVQHYRWEQQTVPDVLTAKPDAHFGKVFSQSIKTRLSPFALMDEFNRPKTQETFLRLMAEDTVELYSKFELAVAKVGAEKIIGMFDAQYRWFDARDVSKAHHP